MSQIQKKKDEKVPLLKREISFKRQPKGPKLPAQPRGPKPKPLSSLSGEKQEAGILKREVTLSRKPVHHEMVGLKIGASQLAAALVDNHEAPKLLKLARQRLPQGIVSSGEVRDVPALAAALDEFFRANGLPRRGVRLGLATSRVGVRTVEIAGVDDERQLANAVLFRAHEALSIPVDEAVMDHHVIGEHVDESGTVTRKILLVVAYRESVDRFITACKQANIELAGIDLEAFALLRAFAAPRVNGSPQAAALVAVNVGHDRTTLAVSDGKVCQFTRVLEWGGSNLVAAVARELRVPYEQAEQLLLAVSLVSTNAGAPGSDERLPHAADVARRELQALARELVASLEFYQAQAESLPIAEILLAGGTARLAGLPQELERLTRVRVRPADPLVRLSVANGFETGEDLPSLAVAIGLGVND